MSKQPPPYNPGYAYPPPQLGAYLTQQKPQMYAQPQPQYSQVPPYGQPQQQQVYVHQPQQKSTGEKLGSGLGGAFATVFKSGKDLTKGSGKVVSSVGKTLVGSAADLAKGAPNLASNTAKGFKDESDRTADSPLLRCFQMGSGIQLMSKPGQGCLRCLPNGLLDGRGQLGQDYSCHWLVVSRWENKVILRNGAYPQFHLSNALNQTVATGVGDNASSFKLHETPSHYVTLEHQMTSQYVGVDNQQNIVPANQVTNNGLNSHFEVHLVYSPTGHLYKPVH